MLFVAEKRKRAVGRPLCPKRKSYFLLQKLLSGLSDPGNLVMDLSARTVSAAVACLNVQRHRVLVWCEPHEECFRLGEEVAMRRPAKAAAHDGTDVELSGKSAETALVVGSLVPDVVVADQLRPLSDGLPLKYCLILGVLTFFEISLVGYGTCCLYARRPVHCRDEPHLSRTRGAGCGAAGCT